MRAEKSLMSKEELFNKIATFTGGRVAEELKFGSITTGASNDIEQATRLARRDDYTLRHERGIRHGCTGNHQ